MDIKQEITNKIIALLEKGDNKSSQMWVSVATNGFPSNGKSGVCYRGLNVFLLWSAAREMGYERNVWLTFKQAEAMGGKIRKGEKAVLCSKYSTTQGDEAVEAVEDVETKKAKKFALCRPFYLFNVAQIEGLPENLTAINKNIEFNPIEKAEQLLIASGVKIIHGGNKAFYSPSKDTIYLPKPEAFTSRENYYAVALHELVHSTGSMTKCNRRMSKRFGKEVEAAEEIIADMGAAMLMAYLGIVNATIENHASYIEHWIQILRKDKSAIFKASIKASAAYDYILGKAGLLAPVKA